MQSLANEKWKGEKVKMQRGAGERRGLHVRACGYEGDSVFLTYRLQNSVRPVFHSIAHTWKCRCMQWQSVHEAQAAKQPCVDGAVLSWRQSSREEGLAATILAHVSCKGPGASRLRGEYRPPPLIPRQCWRCHTEDL